MCRQTTFSLSQASKVDQKQPSIASVLQPLPAGAKLDVVVAGCGPAGLHLAAVMATKGINVGLVGECAVVG
jgi:ribulose 1,5-bisphosphate synthetase/thiazole synthase